MLGGLAERITVIGPGLLVHTVFRGFSRHPSEHRSNVESPPSEILQGVTGAVVQVVCQMIEFLYGQDKQLLVFLPSGCLGQTEPYMPAPFELA